MRCWANACVDAARTRVLTQIIPSLSAGDQLTQYIFTGPNCPYERGIRLLRRNSMLRHLLNCGMTPSNGVPRDAAMPLRAESHERTR